MSSKPSHKILRIGVIQSGKIIEERLMRSSKTVTVGSDFSKKNELIIPTSSLPKSIKLFEFKDGKYFLRFRPGWGGRVSFGDGVETLQELVSSGRAQKKGKEALVPLTPRSRGKVSIGDVTILFQFVTPPPKKPKPVLPASMRGGWIKGVEPILVAMIALSAIIQIGVVAWLENTDFPEPKQEDIIADDRFVKIMKPEKDEEKEKDEKKQQDKGEGKSEEKAEKSEKKPDPKPEKKAEKQDEPEKDKMTPEERAKAEAERRRRMTEEVRNKTILKKVGAKGSGGSMVDSLVAGASDTDVDAAFDGAKGVAEGGPGAEKDGLGTAGSQDADGTGGTAGIGGLKESDAAAEAAGKNVDTGQKQEKTVKANIKGGEQQQVGMGKLSASSISKVVRRKQAAIQRCYERVLKQNPEAGGKLVVQFTIGRRGRVTKTNVLTDISGGSVGSCVTNNMKRWRFPKPDGGNVTVKKTFVLEASQ